MTKYLTALCIILGLSLAPKTSSAQIPTPAEHRAIADTITQLFASIAEATNSLEFDRLLGYYQESEDLTYVAQGRVIRSYDAFSEVMDLQLRGLRGADLRWLKTYVDVLSSDVAVATAIYEFTATLPDGDTVNSAGTFMCIYLRQEGRWQIRYSAHSFPPRGS